MTQHEVASNLQPAHKMEIEGSSEDLFFGQIALVMKHALDLELKFALQLVEIVFVVVG